MKILIVDDELVSRKTLQKILKGAGECVSAENGEDALTIAMSDIPPDLILLDIIMPDMDGYEVCSKLKAIPKTREIPVIFISVNVKPEDMKMGFALGAVDYITKPFNKEVVRTRIQTHLSLKKAHAELYEKNIELEYQLEQTEGKTEQLRQKDLQLLEMDRIADIGIQAASMAHEINSTLDFLENAMVFLKKNMDKMLAVTKYWDDKPLPEELEKGYRDYIDTLNYNQISNATDKKFDAIQRGMEKIATIIKSLQRFSQVDMESIGTLSINESIDDAVEILSTEETGEVDFIKELGEIPSLTCSASEINQCLLHLLTNALYAVEGKGKIFITTSLNQTGDYIIVRIIDNGKGMSPEVLRQAQNPFFTTKAVGSETGIDLAMTESIIKRHGGTINISSKEIEGTSVTLTLPVIGKTSPQN